MKFQCPNCKKVHYNPWRHKRSDIQDLWERQAERAVSWPYYPGACSQQCWYKFGQCLDVSKGVID